MRDGKGYLLPENVQPEGLLCLKIWIPNDPTGFYLAAMSGAYSDMARWVQWEKDGTNRASLAAQTWKDAVDYTYENGWLNCGMDCCEELNDRLDSIELLLKGLTDMNINVNCGCGCGCGCKNGSNGGVNDDGTPINQPLPPPPLTTEPEEFVGQWKCDAANQFVDDWIDFYNELTTAGGVAGASFAVLLPIFIAATILTGGVAAILAIVAALTLGPAVQFGEWVGTWLAENRQGLICAMTNSLTPAGAYQNVVAYLLAHKADQNGSFAGEWVENLLKPVFQDTNWNLLYEPDSFEIDLANGGSTCNCQSIIQLGEEDWYLVPALEGEEFVNNDASYQVTNYIWSFVGTGVNQHAQSYPAFTEFLASGRTWLEAGGTPVAGTNEHAGYVMVRVGGDTNVQTFDITGSGIIGVDGTDFPLHDVWTEWHVDSDLPKLDFQAELETIFDGLDIVHEGDQDFTNLAFHRMTMRGLDTNPRTVQFQVFAVIAASALNLS